MTPYFCERGITIYCGDCRDILPHVAAEAIITDPVWPNCEHIFPGLDAFALLATALNAAAWARRCVINLGNNSDPRFLTAVPARIPFLRTCYLEYAVVGYLGRILRDAEVAYVFGEPPASKPGQRVLPGRTIAVRCNGDKGWSNKARTKTEVDARVAKMHHPTRRLLDHARWLVKWFGGASVCDPFMGSGTTALACKLHGTPFVGIEIEERYCEIAAKRLAQHQLAFDGVLA
jgi:hypothetical protein